MYENQTGNQHNAIEFEIHDVDRVQERDGDRARVNA